jgi:hypothetical protein
MYYLVKTSLQIGRDMAQPLGTGRSMLRPKLKPGPVSVKFVVDKVALGLALLQVLLFPLVSVILLVLHIHFHPQIYS